MSAYLVAMVTLQLWPNNEMATMMDSISSELSRSESYSSELECDLMITSLERELNLVRVSLESRGLCYLSHLVTTRSCSVRVIS